MNPVQYRRDLREQFVDDARESDEDGEQQDQQEQASPSFNDVPLYGPTGIARSPEEPEEVSINDGQDDGAQGPSGYTPLSPERDEGQNGPTFDDAPFDGPTDISKSPTEREDVSINDEQDEQEQNQGFIEGLVAGANNQKEKAVDATEGAVETTNNVVETTGDALETWNKVKRGGNIYEYAQTDAFEKYKKEFDESDGLYGKFESAFKANLDYGVDNPQFSAQDTIRGGLAETYNLVNNTPLANGADIEDPEDFGQGTQEAYEGAVDSYGDVTQPFDDVTPRPADAALDGVVGAGEFVGDIIVGEPARAAYTIGTGVDPETGETDASVGPIDFGDALLSATGIGKLAPTGGKIAYKGLNGLQKMGLFKLGARVGDETISGLRGTGRAVQNIKNPVGNTLQGVDDVGQRINDFSINDIPKNTPLGRVRNGETVFDVGEDVGRVGDDTTKFDEGGQVGDDINQTVKSGDEVGQVGDTTKFDEGVQGTTKVDEGNQVGDDIGQTVKSGDEVGQVGDETTKVDEIGQGTTKADEGLQGSQSLLKNRKVLAGLGIAGGGAGLGLYNEYLGGGPLGGGGGGPRGGGPNDSSNKIWGEPEVVDKTAGGCVIYRTEAQDGTVRYFTMTVDQSRNTVAVTADGDTQRVNLETTLVSDLPLFGTEQQARDACSALHGDESSPEGSQRGMRVVQEHQSGALIWEIIRATADSEETQGYAVSLGSQGGEALVLDDNGSQISSGKSTTALNNSMAVLEPRFASMNAAINTLEAWLESGGGGGGGNQRRDRQDRRDDRGGPDTGTEGWTDWQEVQELSLGWYLFARAKKGDRETVQYTIVGQSNDGSEIYLKPDGTVQRSEPVIYESLEAVKKALEAFADRKQNGEVDERNTPSGAAPSSSSVQRDHEQNGARAANRGGLSGSLSKAADWSKDNPMLAAAGGLLTAALAYYWYQNYYNE